MYRNGLWVGTTAGLAIGIFLWIVEKATGIKVYTLLMNVDFIPWIGKIAWPFYVEWLFHLIISWGIGMIFVYLLRNSMIDSHSHQWSLALTLATLAGLTYFPLTALAIKETPAIDSISAIFFWSAGHGLYAVVMKLTYRDS
ncbi:hypothetical protein GCM10007216_01260 [Thalassobacillus devorans]|uniref:Uncharacterized protein n=1 Tax=Thalassobacillus devorans TaxID=279813 RepID=A0ABQ1NID4_9BACI|nr:hypothetical protein [Thalassobacillus devorans]NIK27034.1 hypothetical protein [Thalassobacillus devorans]GGC74407.1 hypothetical protein GCM10007216_01260 [Thalassobacillus devorans]